MIDPEETRKAVEEQVLAAIVRARRENPEAVPAHAELMALSTLRVEPPSAGVNGWRKMETAPKDGTSILAVYRGELVPHLVRWRADAYEAGAWVSLFNDRQFLAEWEREIPEKWQPLPSVYGAPE